MKSFEIEDIKGFMKELLVSERFDSFYLYEAGIKTKHDYQINGRINEAFFDSDELDMMRENDSLPEYSCWQDMKPLVVSLLKGDKLPLKLKIILMFNRENIRRLIDMHKIALDEASVGALFYNIYYEDKKLSVTTGSSLKVFTLDKSLENVWDETVEKYYIL